MSKLQTKLIAIFKIANIGKAALWNAEIRKQIPKHDVEYKNLRNYNLRIHI